MPELPVSSTFIKSLPEPVTVRAPWTLSSLPLVAGARLPMLIVLAPLPVFTLVIEEVLWILAVSAPLPRERFSVVMCE